jgi:N-acetylmuramoyl-L-alanine amidase
LLDRWTNKPAPAWLAVACAIALALGLSTLGSAPLHADEPGASRSAVLGSLDLFPGPDGTRLVLQASTDVSYRMSYDESTKTATVILPGTVPAPGLAPQREVNDGAVHQLRVTETPNGLEVAIEMLEFSRIEPAASLQGAGTASRIVIDVPRPGVEARRAAQDRAYRDLRAAAERVVMIDPGHGGDQTGAIGPKRTIEKVICLEIAKKLQARLNQAPGVHALLTREGDYNVALRDRYHMAERVKADAFVSIHCNSGRRPTGRGTEVYFLSLESASDEQSKLLADEENAADLVGQTPSKDSDLVSILFDLKQNEVIRQSSALAENVLDQIMEHSRLENRGVKQAPFAVLKSPVVPSILVETAFINHPAEAKLLRDPSFQTELANQIALGVLDYLKTAPHVSRDGDMGTSGMNLGRPSGRRANGS